MTACASPTKAEYVDAYVSYLCSCSENEECEGYLSSFESCDYDPQAGQECVRDLSALDNECEWAPLSCEYACP